MQWLYQVRKRYQLKILNQMATSNHVHLLVVDTGKREVIPESIQLVPARTGQEYNQRKNILIDYERLQDLFGSASYDQPRTSHRAWLEQYVGNGAKSLQDKWTECNAVGSRSFVENVKALLSFKAKGGVPWKMVKDISSERELSHITRFSGPKRTI